MFDDLKAILRLLFSCLLGGPPSVAPTAEMLARSVPPPLPKANADVPDLTAYEPDRDSEFRLVGESSRGDDDFGLDLALAERRRSEGEATENDPVKEHPERYYTWHGTVFPYQGVNYPARGIIFSDDK